MWKCKECSLELASRYLLLQHFRQTHGHFRGSYRFPCPYTDCPCTFNTWSKLLNHTYKSHAKQTTPKPLEVSTFQCHVCSCRELASEREFFHHLNGHLRHNETVPCVFLGCTFKTNIYSTFNTHKNRKHNQHSLKDFQANVVCTSTNLHQLDNSADGLTESIDTDHEYETLSRYDPAELQPTNFIEEKIACILLKLENIVHIPKAVIDEVLSELHFILSRPHAIPCSFTSSNTTGGNAHENWTLLRFLPFVIGHIVPEEEPAWLVILDLKDIVELVVAPVHTDETVAYLEAKIYDHRQRYLDLFPHVKLLPKHHYLEHYPQMIRRFGPLVALWTMRFEAKHSFFKQVARHTNCFKNIPRSLATKHQFMLAYHTHASNFKKSSLEVTDVSIMPVDVLSEGVRSKLHQRYPEVTEVHMATHLSYSGICYSKGMLIVHGSLDGLPKFYEIIQLCIVKENLCFLVRGVCAWYREHYGGFELSASPTREVALIELGDLEDPYPLVEYIVGGLRMVMLKRFVIVKDQD